MMLKQKYLKVKNIQWKKNWKSSQRYQKKREKSWNRNPMNIYFQLLQQSAIKLDQN